MRFSAEHRFSAPPAAVADALADPAFHETLELPDLSLPAVVEHDTDAGGVRRLVLRYEFTGHLDALARRLLGGRRLEWTQAIRLDGSGGGSLMFAADANPSLLHGQATFTLAADAGGGTLRHLDGELIVAVPGIGSMAERRIVPGVLARLDVEAAAVERRVSAA